MVRLLPRSRRGLNRVHSAPQRRVLRAETLEPRLVLSAAVTPLTLGDIADAYVSGAAPRTNYGSAADLLVQNASSGFNSNDAEAYLRFDLTVVTAPSAKVVLNLTPLALGSSASSMTLGVQLLRDRDDAWVEGAGGTNRNSTGPITWMNSPYGYGTVVSIPGSKLTTGAPLAIDVTQLVAQSFNANHIVSFVVGVISRPGARQSVDFASRENVNAACRPTLTITPVGPVNPPPTVATPAAASSAQVSGASVGLSVLGADANYNESNLSYTWSVAGPSGAAAPTFSVNGTNGAKNTTVTFRQAGVYTFAAKITNTADGLAITSNVVTVTVNQSLASVAVAPAAITVPLGGTQAFAAQGLDQFGRAMAIPTGSTVVWSVASANGAATTGTISSTGSATAKYVAPGVSVKDLVTATVGALKATAAVSVSTAFLNLQDPVISALVQSLDADGSISRADMLQVFSTVAAQNGGLLSATDYADLKTILASSSILAMPQYVQVLASDVINGNRANAKYQGQTLGNLTVGSPAAQLQKLVSKWFLGTDLPAAGSYQYDTATAGTLFGAAAPSHLDELQGHLGDCYLIAALGSLADSSPAAVANMFVDNGDGTWTVRFYAGGVADYVTVNSRLPVSTSNTLVYQGLGRSATNSGNVLWLALAEKAYSQWNETGKEGRNGLNTYAAIEGGWMSDVDGQVLGYAATDYALYNSGAQQALINGVTGGKAVTIGTLSTFNSAGGLYGSHAYSVTAYNSATGAFTLYNPWGSNQPGPLTFSQLQQYCDVFTVADPARSTPFSASSGAGTVVIHAVISPPLANTTVASLSYRDTRVDIAATANADLAASQAVSSTVVAWLHGSDERLTAAQQRSLFTAEQNWLDGDSRGSIGDDLPTLAVDQFLRGV